MNSKNSDDTQGRSNLKPQQRDLIRNTRAKIKQENADLHSARNARRWKAERDPQEYEAQKQRQRAEYAAENGGVVRSYEKIEGKTRDEHDENAKKRHAEKEQKRYGNLSPEEKQAKSDQSSDNRFRREKKKAGWSEERIQAALVIKQEARQKKREAKAQADAEQAALEAQKNYGMF
ncbi:hypothetical protein [Celeribacter neptunius]|uniref:Uncharacterized protein n=1 Tax=Celeribacter neptunius TaxID=588602 RepID=A0A1I3LGZ2_9RHOB|nr:hypothetical protein [Celeribacter neptunius]SFI83987.1 hypothetical protein SAMN04487991_1026 [Celeribacter neptunius]